MRVTWDKQAKRLKNPNDKKLHNSGGGLLIVYNNQREEHRFVQPFVIIGKVGKPFVIIGGVEKKSLLVNKQIQLFPHVGASHVPHKSLLSKVLRGILWKSNFPLSLNAFSKIQSNAFRTPLMFLKCYWISFD